MITYVYAVDIGIWHEPQLQCQHSRIAFDIAFLICAGPPASHCGCMA